MAAAALVGQQQQQLVEAPVEDKWITRNVAPLLGLQAQDERWEECTRVSVVGLLPACCPLP